MHLLVLRDCVTTLANLETFQKSGNISLTKALLKTKRKKSNTAKAFFSPSKVFFQLSFSFSGKNAD